VNRRRTDQSSEPPDVSVDFDHDHDSPRKARAALLPLLSDPNDPIAANVELAASELVSNAVQHTSDGGTVRAWDPRPDIPFRLEVSDNATEFDASSSTSEHGGRGLSIVDELADEWGVQPNGEGKTIWAEFDRSRFRDTQE